MEKLTKKDLQKRWGICERTHDRWKDMKGLPYHKLPVNGRIYFYKEEIEEWENKMMGGKVD